MVNVATSGFNMEFQQIHLPVRSTFPVFFKPHCSLQQAFSCRKSKIYCGDSLQGTVHLWETRSSIALPLYTACLGPTQKPCSYPEYVSLDTEAVSDRLLVGSPSPVLVARTQSDPSSSAQGYKDTWQAPVPSLGAAASVTDSSMGSSN